MVLIQIISQTWVIILFALFICLIYVVIATYNRGLSDSVFMDCSSVGFASVSIIGGLKLSLISFFLTYNENTPLIDMNIFYSVYGGMAVIIVSLRTIKVKFCEAGIKVG